MIKRLIQRGVVLLAAAAIMASADLAAWAQTNETPPAAKGRSAEKKAGTEKKQKTLPFHGTLKAVDKATRTIAVGERVFQVTPETRIYKADKPAQLQDGVPGERVTGSYKSADGKLTAVSIYFGGKGQGKGDSKGPQKKQEKKATSEQ